VCVGGRVCGCVCASVDGTEISAPRQFSKTVVRKCLWHPKLGTKV